VDPPLAPLPDDGRHQVACLLEPTIRRQIWSGLKADSRVPAGYWYIPPKDFPALASQFRKDQTPYPIAAPASGGIVSSPADAARWYRALFNGRMLPTKQQRELQSVVSEKTGKPIAKTTVADPAGFGLGLQQTTSRTLGMFWTYEGETFGFRFILAYKPSSGTVIAIGANSHPLHDELPQLFVSVYRSLHPAR
jgi:D-alanyl-D-alanine carboxypeptidase